MNNTSFNGNQNINQVNNMQGMRNQPNSFQNINSATQNVNQVNSMQGMQNQPNSFQNINSTTPNTNQVNSMQGMQNQPNSFQNINSTTPNTNQVNNMPSMQNQPNSFQNPNSTTSNINVTNQNINIGLQIDNTQNQQPNMGKNSKNLKSEKKKSFFSDRKNRKKAKKKEKEQQKNVVQSTNEVNSTLTQPNSSVKNMNYNNEISNGNQNTSIGLDKTLATNNNLISNQNQSTNLNTNTMSSLNSNGINGPAMDSSSVVQTPINGISAYNQGQNMMPNNMNINNNQVRTLNSNFAQPNVVQNKAENDSHLASLTSLENANTITPIVTANIIQEEQKPFENVIPITPAVPISNSVSDEGHFAPASNETAERISLDTRLEEAELKQQASQEESVADEIEELDDVEVLDYEFTKAGVFQRILADLIDSIIVLLVIASVYVGLSTIFIFVENTVLNLIINIFIIIALTFGYLVYRTINEKTGNTIGRKATRTLVLDDEYEKIKVSTSLLRTLITSIINGTGIGFVVNIILMSTDKEKKGIQDKIFKTMVIDTKA